jgi:hypothetical protein
VVKSCPIAACDDLSRDVAAAHGMPELDHGISGPRTARPAKPAHF